MASGFSAPDADSAGGYFSWFIVPSGWKGQVKNLSVRRLEGRKECVHFTRQQGLQCHDVLQNVSSLESGGKDL